MPCEELIITGCDTFIVGNPWKNWVFISLDTTEGIQGIGEASLNGFALSTQSAIHELQQYFIGKSAFDVKDIRRSMLLSVYSDGGQIHRSATTAVETACWDIVGKALGRPLYQLWGGSIREDIRTYGNGWYRTERDPESFAERAKNAIGLGYTALKVDPFGSTRGGFTKSGKELSLEIIKAIKDAIPENTDLFIEGHCRFDVPTAIELSYSLGNLDIGWFEEPVAYWNTQGLTEVSQRSPVRIATGENLTRFSDFIELTRHTRNLVLQPDVMNLGGLEEARLVCDMGEALQKPVAPHDAQGPISKAMCLQLAALSPAIGIQEDFELFNDPWTETLSSPLNRGEGCIFIPSDPGIGRTLNFDAISEHPYDENATLALFTEGWEQRQGL